jgi:hypothetical protein
MRASGVELSESILKSVSVIADDVNVSVVGVSDGDVIHNKESVTLVYILSSLQLQAAK